MADTCPLNCTVATCPLACAYIDYLPTLPGNAAYAAIFGTLLIAQSALGIAYRTWGFMTGMTIGLLLEVVGCAGRIMLHDDPFIFSNFITYLVPLTIGPAFICGALYLCLSRIIIVHGEEVSRLRPRTIAITFMMSDFISLVLQGAGGGLTSTADDHAGVQTGVNIMIAGLVFQVVSLFVFGALGLDITRRVRQMAHFRHNDRFANLRASRMFRAFPFAVGAAVVLIFVRSVYRVAELEQGFSGPIANNQVAFMILDGPMVFLAVLAMTIFHPGIAFHGEWARANWTLRHRRSAPSRLLEDENIMESVSPSK